MGFTNHKSSVKKIVDAHRWDFNHNNAKKYINDRGGYAAYVRSLGGIFAKYIDFNYPTQNKKIVSLIQLEEICQYVWGLYDIWGVSYSNGDFHGWDATGYRGEAPFYDGDNGYSNVNYAIGYDSYSGKTPGIDEMLNPNNGYYAVTNCAQGVFQVLKKAGLLTNNIHFDPAEYPGIWNRAGYKFKVITDIWQIRPGDIMLYAKGGFSRKKSLEQDMSSGFVDGSFFHTNIAAEISKDKKTIYYYDSGRGYTREYNGKCRYVRDYGQWPYEWANDWCALRYDVVAKLSNGNFKWEEDKSVHKWHCYEIKDDKTKIELKGWHEVPWSQGIDWFYFDANGEMLTGWHDLKFGKNNSKKGRFYFDSNGAMKTEWQKINGKWYYFEDTDGYLIMNTMKKIKNKWYLFDEDGVMQIGTKTRSVALNSSGQLIG